MNAPTYHSHSLTCPICHHSSSVGPVGMFSGLFICPNCHSHLVISRSGHYVRDPFAIKQLTVGRMLRRQSRPLARIRRDLGFKHLSLLALLGSAVFFSFAIATTNQSHKQFKPFQDLWELVNGAGESSNPSR
ncbi:hypothetical protein BCD67_14865 [Oscillatoriales cyanobacterium USR001]|nr:hypothetical protein BCD67_14865 [Oscillatoriales cyanobacterium USR001]